MTRAADLANLIGNINAGGGGVNRNLVINGAMNVAQRGTSSTGLGATDGYYTCDRWHLDFANTAGRLTMTQDSSAPSGFANSLKLACTTADTSIASGEQFKIEHKIEGQNLQAFAKGTSDAKPFAVSFYVKGNASATYVCELFDVDNSRQCSKTFNVTTDWTRIELTFPADTTGAFDDDNDQSLVLVFFLHAGSDRTSGTLNSSGFASSTNANRAVGISSFFDSTDRTFFLTGVQLEIGQNPTEFEHEPVAQTEIKCYRYTQRLPHRDNTSGSGYASITSMGRHDSTTMNSSGTTLPVVMRADSTMTTSGNFRIHHKGIATDCDSLAIDDNIGTSGQINIAATTSGSLVQGQAGQLQQSNDPDAHVIFSAEL